MIARSDSESGRTSSQGIRHTFNQACSGQNDSSDKSLTTQVFFAPMVDGPSSSTDADRRQKGIATLLANLIISILFSGLLLKSVQCLDCECDCPSGCRIFNTTSGSLSDGSGSACIKESFGVTGQYGPRHHVCTYKNIQLCFHHMPIFFLAVCHSHGSRDTPTPLQFSLYAYDH